MTRVGSQRHTKKKKKDIKLVDVCNEEAVVYCEVRTESLSTLLFINDSPQRSCHVPGG